MYYNVPGNTAYYDINGKPDLTGCTAPNTLNAWEFGMSSGVQGYNKRNNTIFYAWGVHDSDVAVVPVPTAAWLFGSGLISLVGFAKRKKA